MVRAALDRNLHVFCEKPFSLDPEEGLALAELAERKGLVTQVGYQLPLRRRLRGSEATGRRQRDRQAASRAHRGLRPGRAAT
jgi:scyllo-inositol 2-dehydrogenase (NADP+)